MCVDQLLLGLQIVVNFYEVAMSQAQVLCKCHLSSPPMWGQGGISDIRYALDIDSLSVCLCASGCHGGHQTILTGSPSCAVLLYSLKSDGASPPLTKAAEAMRQNKPPSFQDLSGTFTTSLEI